MKKEAERGPKKKETNKDQRTRHQKHDLHVAGKERSRDKGRSTFTSAEPGKDRGAKAVQKHERRVTGRAGRLVVHRDAEQLHEATVGVGQRGRVLQRHRI